MSLSNETKQKINKFAEEQAQNYLENSEMTYFEKLRKKSSRTKSKIGAKLAKFKAHSEKGNEVRDDMALYMNDYIGDLISQGMSEREAFEKAKAEMIAVSESNEQNGDFHDRFTEYYKQKSPAAYEAEGLLFGGFTTIGLVIGGLTGYIAGGGRVEFLNGGWIDMLIGIGCGVVLGAGVAMIANAIIISIKRAMDKFN